MIFGQYLMRTVGVTDVRQTRTVTCLRARTAGNDHISFASIACFLAAIWTLWRNGWEESLLKIIYNLKVIYIYVYLSVCVFHWKLIVFELPAKTIKGEFKVNLAP